MPANYPARANFVMQAKRNLLPLQERITLHCDGQKTLPGMPPSAPGHTVSHSSFIINPGKAQMCCIEDLAHRPVLLLERPRTQFAFDTDPVQSSESRVRMMDMLAANRVPLLAYHSAWPGVGHVVKAGDGFHYLPVAQALGDVAGL
ncbi:MAG TPA: hypothetical protein VGC15_14380 [Acetobacteraceae bacterium]